MSVFARLFSWRRRRPTSRSRPRRLWWACLCSLRCSVRSLIRRVSIATCTSGEPVSPSTVAYSVMICFFVALSSAMVPPGQVTCGPRSVSRGQHAHTSVTRRHGQGYTSALPDRPASPGRALGEAEDGAGPGDVVGHGLEQVRDAGEGEHRSQPLDELHPDVLAVEVAVEVEQVRLHGAPRAGAGGIAAHRARGRVAAAADPAVVTEHQPAGVDAVGRDGGVRGTLRVCCRVLLFVVSLVVLLLVSVVLV